MNRELQVSLIAEEQIPAAGEMLARAFFHDPLCVYTHPDPGARIGQLAWLFTRLVREGARQEAAYISTFNHQPRGVAVWTPPRATGPAAAEAAGNGTDQLARRFGPEEYHRFITAYRHFGRIRHQRMAGPHWYWGCSAFSPNFRVRAWAALS